MCEHCNAMYPNQEIELNEDGQLLCQDCGCSDPFTVLGTDMGNLIWTLIVL